MDRRTGGCRPGAPLTAVTSHTVQVIKLSRSQSGQSSVGCSDPVRAQLTVKGSAAHSQISTESRTTAVTQSVCVCVCVCVCVRSVYKPVLAALFNCWPPVGPLGASVELSVWALASDSLSFAALMELRTTPPLSGNLPEFQ